jgi:hypothetical protein
METTTTPLTPSQALVILSQATEPGAKVSRRDYVLIEHSLEVIGKILAEGSEGGQPESN